MTTKIPDIEVVNRDMSINPRKLRRSGRLPATVYGNKIDPVSIDLDKRSFTYLYNNQVLHLVTLNKEGKNLRALVKKVHVDPITSDILNIEFLQISEDEKVTLTVPLLFENEAPAFKKGATMLQLMDEIEINCLPKDIPEKLIFDMSVVEEIDVTITIADLKLPKELNSILPEDTALIRISSPKGVEESSGGGDSSGADSATVAAAAE